MKQGPAPHISIAEFRALGFVQEINRRILHPAGLALEVSRDPETGAEHISGVQDHRSDPEGVYFGGFDLAEKARSVDAEIAARAEARMAAIGYVIQPTDEAHIKVTATVGPARY